jgi:tRNA A37 N6-isopentenylltransferase MiaA
MQLLLLSLLVLQVTPDLRDELLQMAKADQEVRNRINWTDPDPTLVEEMQRLDRQNAKRLSEIVDTHGWPGKSLVGEDGAHAAWLIVQHAVHDRALMKRCLAKMRESPSEVSPADIAYLTDRMELFEHGKQVYGTQLRIEKDGVSVEPIDDPAHVDERRAAMGLGPLAEYLSFARKQFGK